jgi:hypothetical protein
LAATAASTAVETGLIDHEHGSNYVAEYFGVEDVPKMLKKITDEKTAQQAALERMALGNIPPAAIGTMAKHGAIIGPDDAKPGQKANNAGPPKPNAQPGQQKPPGQ